MKTIIKENHKTLKFKIQNFLNFICGNRNAVFSFLCVPLFVVHGRLYMIDIEQSRKEVNRMVLTFAPCLKAKLKQSFLKSKNLKMKIG
jgi:hypothetical protein